jgi:hypothetical protein
MLENVLQRYLTNSEDIKKYLYKFPLLPGAHVLGEFNFHTIEASIVIPPIPKSGLYCFVFCDILSEGLEVKYNSVRCTIYEHKKEVYQCNVGGRRGELISDHVVLQCWCDNYKLVEVGNESGSGDHYNLSFEFKFKHYVDDKVQWSTKGIKGCGVLPVYGLEQSLRLDGPNSTRAQNFELQSMVQVFDETDQPLKFENEDNQQHCVIPPKKRMRN